MILENQKAKRLVEIVLGIATQEVGAILTLLLESKIITFVIDGEFDISKDNKRIRRISYIVQ